MPYCFNCGKPVNETDNCCPSCGVQLHLREAAPHDGERRFPTSASPEQTRHLSRTRLLTPDSKDTNQTRDYGKTRLIDYDKEESVLNQASGKTRLIDPDWKGAEPTPVSGKTRLMSEEDIARLKDKDAPPFKKSFTQQKEEYPRKQAREEVAVGASVIPWWTKSWFLIVFGFVALGLFGLILFGLGVFDATDDVEVTNPPDGPNQPLDKPILIYATEPKPELAEYEEAKTEKEVAAERVETAEEENLELKDLIEAKERELAEAQAARDAAAAAAFR